MRKSSLAILALLVFWGSPAWADHHVYEMVRPTASEMPLVTATIISDVEAVAPGETFRVGVHYQLLKKWHIYWKYPGATGKPTTLEFAASEGVTVGPVRQPAPSYFPGSAKTWTNGYEEEVLFFAEARAPKDAKPGDSLDISAASTWLACAENCLAEKDAQVRFSVPVAEATKKSEHFAAFESAQARVPVAKEDDLVVDARQNPEKVGPRAAWTYTATFSSGTGAKLENPTFTPGPVRGLRISERSVSSTDKGLEISLAGKTRSRGQLGAFGGILGFDRGGVRHYVEVVLPFNGEKNAAVTERVRGYDALPARAVATEAGPMNLEPPKNITELDSEDQGEQSLALMLLFAFLGGLILNIMPCVLPVLSIKVFSLLEQSRDDKKTIRNHGLVYTAGVMVCFGVLSIPFMLAPQSWGFQMQNPIYLAALSTVVFAFALSLLGVFEVSLPGTNAMNTAVATRHGYSSSFIYGIFAVLLGTPCTAPFLAPALAFLLQQSPLEVFIGLQAVALGLATPFLLLGFMPGWSKWLPKPGAWMETFKSLMGFLLIATAVWLMSSMPKQVTPGAFMGFIAFLAVIGLCAWIYGHWGSPIRKSSTRYTAVAASLGIAILGGFLFLGLETADPAAGAQADAKYVYGPVLTDDEINWRDFASVDVKELSDKGYTVFIDFTADWCVTCKGYEEAVIDTESIKSAFAEKNVIPVQADFTRHDDFIKKWITAAKRPGVPVYLLIPADKPEDAIVLPQHLTTSNLLEGLEKVGPSRAELGGPG